MKHVIFPVQKTLGINSLDFSLFFKKYGALIGGKSREVLALKEEVLKP